MILISYYFNKNVPYKNHLEIENEYKRIFFFI